MAREVLLMQDEKTVRRDPVPRDLSPQTQADIRAVCDANGNIRPQTLPPLGAARPQS